METDAELAALSAAGDERAFARLVRRHQQAVRGVLRRLTRGDLAAADELAQDCFVKAWARMADWRETGSLKSWLCRIAYTEFLQAQRKEKTRRRYEDAAALERDAEIAPVDVPGTVALDRALVSLKPDERACVVMSFAAGMSHSEVAAATGLALGTVKSHITRGKAKLRAILAPEAA